MASLGMWLTVIGLVLFHFALTLTFHANPDRPVPFTRHPLNRPFGSTILRIIGAALIVLGAVLLANVAWYWPLIVVACGPVAAGIAILRHNHRARKLSVR